MFFWNSLVFSVIQRMLAIWSLVPLSFLNPAWISGSSQLKRVLENFEHYFTRVWDECNWVVWALFREGKGNPLQYSGLENSMDCIVHWVAKSRTWLSDFHSLTHLSILWHYLSLGLEWKLTLSSPVATAEFSTFADILSAALSQHHLLGFEIAELEFHHLHQLCS